MSRLLIITAWYHPFIHPRAHRWTAIAEYWAAQGHEVHVLTARHRDCPEETLLQGVWVHRVGFDSLKEFFYFHFGSSQARGRVGNRVSPPTATARLAAWLYRFFWKNIYFPDDAALWYFAARKKARLLLSAQSFDGFLSVSLPFTGHLIGLSTKNRFPKLPWLADIGDPFSIQEKAPNNPWLYRRFNRRLERQVLEKADVSTVTTDFTRRRYRQFFGETATARLEIIPPLLFPVPVQPPPPNQPSRICRIGYFGALYAPVRTPDAFLDLLAETLQQDPALRDRLEVHFYGEIFPEFYARLRASPVIRLHGLRPRAEVQAAMQQMDVLLNIGNQSDFQLPSKAVDYLAAAKPVVNIRYVDDDPFAAFLGEQPWILHLKVTDGKVETAGREAWLAWLAGSLPVVNQAYCRTQTAAFTLPQIAGRYQDLLGF